MVQSALDLDNHCKQNLLAPTHMQGVPRDPCFLRRFRANAFTRIGGLDETSWAHRRQTGRALSSARSHTTAQKNKTLVQSTMKEEDHERHRVQLITVSAARKFTASAT